MRRWLCLILVLVVAIDGYSSPSLLGAEAPRLTTQEKRAIRKVLGSYRRARRDLDAKAAAIAQAASLGPTAVEEVLQLVNADLKPMLDRYRQDFLKASRTAAAKKYQSANMEEVAKLQQTVLALQQDPELTKETIVQVADPAMLRLQELLILEPQAVLGQHRQLVEQREKMQGIGLLWQACQQYLEAASGEGAAAGNPPEKEKQERGRTTFAAYLAQQEQQVLRAALPLSDSTRQVLDYNATLADKLTVEEANCLDALNMTRVLLGLEPLRLDLKLLEAARGHSADMRDHKFFAHDSPLEGKRSFTDRAKLAGTTASGENIAMGHHSGFKTNLQWFHSPGHHRNMLGKHVRVGIGQAGKHWTELFGR